MHPKIDIIIATRDNVDILKTCVESILEKTRYDNYQILIVDNDSQTSDTYSYYQSLSEDKLIVQLNYPGIFNYSAINNYAVNISDADIVVLLNNDTEIISECWLDELARQASRQDVGCVGAKLYYSNKRIQHGGVLVGVSGVAGHAHRYSRGDRPGFCGRLELSQNYSAVTAACLAVRRDTYLDVGGLDEVNLAVSWNDVDFCLKVKSRGFRNLWTPYAELFHHEGLSRGSDDTASKRKQTDAERQFMMSKWDIENIIDPAFHPLLARDSESFVLADAISQPSDFGLPIVSG
jgi:GT2 family glycosyltransferase